jgi:DNA-binding response OmpR family regulator
MDGFQVLRYLREGGDPVPVLMLTARAEEADRLQGLVTGADDYLAKPFSILELIARIRAILRRVRAAPPRPLCLRSGPFRIDLGRRTVKRGQKEVKLANREFRLLEVLLAKPGKTHSRQELVNLAWEPGGRPGLRTVDVHMVGLRRKLGEDERRPFILTVEGVGYCWTAEVREAPGP